MDFDNTTDTITPDITSVLTIGGLGALGVPSGATADRPLDAVNGAVRYNATISNVEAFIAGSWTTLATQDNALGDRSGFFLFDDFVRFTYIPAGTLNTATYNNTWQAHANGTGTQISTTLGNTYQKSNYNTMGVLGLSTGTVATGIAAFTSGINAVCLGYGAHDFEARVLLPAVPSTAQTYVAQLGFMDTVTAATASNCLYLVADRTYSATNWVLRYQNAGTLTNVATSVAISTTAFVKLRITVVNGTVTVYINDVQVFTAALATVYATGTNPTMGFGARIAKSVGTTASLLYVDYIRYSWKLTTAR